MAIPHINRINWLIQSEDAKFYQLNNGKKACFQN